MSAKKIAETAESHADAVLIASAPDLLAALRLTFSMLNKASLAGALYGRHDVAWLAVRDSVSALLEGVDDHAEAVGKFVPWLDRAAAGFQKVYEKR